MSAVLRAAWHGAINPMRWWSWLFLSAPILGLLFIGFFRSGKTFIVLASILACLVLIGVWVQLVANVLTQNHPTLARLLPGQTRRLRLSLVLPFLALVAAAEGLGWFIYARGFGAWIAVSLLYIAFCVRWPWLWATTALAGLIPMLRYLPKSVGALIVDSFSLLGSGLGLLSLVTVACVLLAGLIRHGDALHAATYTRSLAQRQAMRASMRGESNVSSSGRFMCFTSRFASRSIEALLARGAKTRAAIDLALGPRAHAVSLGLPLVILTVIVACVVAGLSYVGAFANYSKASYAIGNCMFGFIGVLLSSLSQLHATAVGRKGEQALVSLLPGMPRGAAFNRQLGVTLMRKFVMLWLASALALGALLGTLPGTGPAMLCFSLACLPAGVLLWRDWSSAGPLTGWLNLLLYATVMPLALTGRWALENDHMSAASYVLIILALCLLLGGWRWRAILSAPRAWPSGRR